MLGGVCVNRDGSSPLAHVTSCGARALKLPLSADIDLTDYLTQAKALDLSVVGVLDRDSFSDRVDWRRSIGRDLDRVVRLADRRLLDGLVVGHEFDDGWLGPGMSDDPRTSPRGGVGSWVLSFAELAELVYLVESGVDSEVPLILGGLSSGQSWALDRLDLSPFSAISVHVYGWRPSDAWPDPIWGSGTLDDLLDGYRQRLVARGQGELGLVVGELGLSKYALGRGMQAEWCSRTLSVLARRGDVDAAFVFADSDRTADGYGVFRHDGAPEPAVAAIAAVFATCHAFSVVLLPGPDESSAVVSESSAESSAEPSDDEPLPWTETDWTADQLAELLAIGTPSADLVRAIERNWVEFGPWLNDVQLLDDRPSKIHLLASIAVKTGGTFMVIEEHASYRELEQRYGVAAALGHTLGNHLLGDGARYRGRGLIPILGCLEYVLVGTSLQVNLMAEPQLVLEAPLAAGAAVIGMMRRDIPTLVRDGNWEQAYRTIEPTLNGYHHYIALVERLWASLAPRVETPEQVGATLAAVSTEAHKQLGAPFAWAGSSPGGFDAAGFVAYAYQQAARIELPHYTDAIFALSDPIAEASARPGDLIFYQYLDPSQSGVSYPHVGLVDERSDQVLDSRGGVGVGHHLHVQGAVRFYRRLQGLPSLQPEPTEAPEGELVGAHREGEQRGSEEVEQQVEQQEQEQPQGEQQG